MLPTKGYFQDIECPFYNSSCGRPYCHFRHKRRPNETADENIQETVQNLVPTYKPTPKSELANIHNNKSHIPISYVPDLAFKRGRTIRPIAKIDKPTYKPTPLSILSSANKLNSSTPAPQEHESTIKDIRKDIANNVYDPLKSGINFEDLSQEFDLIDDIINDSGSEPQNSVNKNLIKLESDIEKQQNKLNLLKSELSTTNHKEDSSEKNDKCDIKIKTEKTEEISTNKTDDLTNDVIVKEKVIENTNSEKRNVTENKGSEKNSKTCEKDSKNLDKDIFKKTRKKSDKKDRSSTSSRDESKESSKGKEKSPNKTEHSKTHKSREREKHRKEDKKSSSKEKLKNKDEAKDQKKSPKVITKDKKKSKHRNSESSSSEVSYSESSIEKDQEKQKRENKKSGHRSQSKNKIKRKKSRSRSRSSTIDSKLKHKSRARSRSRKRHKEKDRKRSRSKEKDKYKNSKSNKDKSNLDSKKKDGKGTSKRTDDKKGESQKPLKRSTSESSNNVNDNDNVYISSDVDLDLEDEDETMRECYKIFNEYKPETVSSLSKAQDVEKKDLFEEETHHGKKRTAHAAAENTTSLKLPPVAKPKTISTPGEILTNRYKLAKLAQGNNEQENIINEVKNIVRQPPKRPATSLLEAARLHKIKKMQEQKLKDQQQSVNVVDDILNGVHKPSVSHVKVQPKRIAAVPNVALIEKAKERISQIKQQNSQVAKTVAQTKKGGRVAHVPEFSLSDIPDVRQADKSKLPVNVRTRFLTLIAEECFKLYALKEDAYTRALNEEFTCYEKCKVLATYRNSAMLAINRLRKEIQDRESKGLGLLLSGESSVSDKDSDFKGLTFYNHVKKWLLTEEELDVHGYPREGPQKGKAVINNRKEVDFSIIDENQRKCSRCSKIYQVDDDGWPLFEEECMYHPLKKRTIRGEQVYLCCKSNDDMGCATSDTHVFDGLEKHLLEGYQTTLSPRSDDDPRSTAVYALDCEMCYTTKGLELTRVTIVDTECKTVYESFVKPLNPIIDYNTRFSGITKEQMDRTSTSILQIQANILHLCNSETILVGHSLESDMKALKIIHGTIIDTSVLFPHKMGLPHKRALRVLASEYLKKIIQNDVSGHDSAEDAIACMDLIRWKLKEELKVRTK